jgi:hypothetical protein
MPLIQTLRESAITQTSLENKQEETTTLNNLLPTAVLEIHPVGLAKYLYFGYYVN